MLKRIALVSAVLTITSCGSSDQNSNPTPVSPYDKIAIVTNTVGWPFDNTDFGTGSFQLGGDDNTDTIILKNAFKNGLSFPDDFQFGVAGSAYQYEGNRQAPSSAHPNGVGWSIWDVFSQPGSWLNPNGTNIEEIEPTKSLTHPNGSVAIKGFERAYYLNDIQKVKDLGVQTYRLSISWPRLFPHAGMDVPDQAGLAYYVDVLQAIKAAGLTPLVTLYHWDLPAWLYNFGDPTITDEANRTYGWLDMRDAKDNLTIKEFQKYAAAVYQHLGQYTPHFATFNEPWTFTNNSFAIGNHAPGKNGFAHLQSINPELYGATNDETVARLPYLQAVNIIKAHTIAYKTIHALYQNNPQNFPKPIVTIVLNSDWAEPFRIACNTSGKQCQYNQDDLAAAQRNMDFMLGWWLNPVMFGSWPASMNDIYTHRIRTGAQPTLGQFGDSSCLQGDGQPVACDGNASVSLTDDIRQGGTLDAVMINHYTGYFVADLNFAKSNFGATPAEGIVPPSQYGGKPSDVLVGWNADQNNFITPFRYLTLGDNGQSAPDGRAFVIGKSGAKPWLLQTWFVYRKLMQYINHNYLQGQPHLKTKGGVPFSQLAIYLTENGTSIYNESQESAVGNNRCDPSLNKKLCDPNRIEYMLGNIAAVHQARVEDGINIKLYTYWSIADNFEWAEGYNSRFGLVWIDYATFNRELKQSYKCFQSIVMKRGPQQVVNQCPVESQLGE